MRRVLQFLLPAVVAAAALPIAVFLVQTPAQALENNLARTRRWAGTTGTASAATLTTA